MRTHLWMGLLLAGCGGGDVASCELEGIGAGSLRGSVDGSPWTTDGAAWSRAGEGVQVTTDEGDGFRMTLSLQADRDGTPMGAAVDAGELPIEVSLDDDTVAWALLYPTGAGSMTSKGTAGGLVTVESISAGTLGICFAFEAGEGADAHSVQGGALLTEFVQR